MSQPAPHPEDAKAPQAYRDALAEMVQVGLRVARMVGQVADAETALAEAASQSSVAEGVSPLATSLAEAIEADRAAAAAAEMRQTVVARTEAIAHAFARLSRAVRLTILLAERLDRGWARAGLPADRHAKALRQIAQGVADAIGRGTARERTAKPATALTERMDALDTESGISDRPADEIIAEICRYFALDPVPMATAPPQPGATGGAGRAATASATRGGTPRQPRPPHRRPDG